MQEKPTNQFIATLSVTFSQSEVQLLEEIICISIQRLLVYSQTYELVGFSLMKYILGNTQCK